MCTAVSGLVNEKIHTVIFLHIKCQAEWEIQLNGKSSCFISNLYLPSLSFLGFPEFAERIQWKFFLHIIHEKILFPKY